MIDVMYPRVQWRGLTAFARRNKACIFRKIIYVTLFWNRIFSQNNLELGLSPARDSQSNRLTCEDTEYNLSLF